VHTCIGSCSPNPKIEKLSFKLDAEVCVLAWSYHSDVNRKKITRLGFTFQISLHCVRFVGDSANVAQNLMTIL